MSTNTGDQKYNFRQRAVPLWLFLDEYQTDDTDDELMDNQFKPVKQPSDEDMPVERQPDRQPPPVDPLVHPPTIKTIALLPVLMLTQKSLRIQIANGLAYFLKSKYLNSNQRVIQKL